MLIADTDFYCFESKSHFILLQENIHLWQLEIKHWLCHAGTSSHDRQVSGHKITHFEMFTFIYMTFTLGKVHQMLYGSLQRECFQSLCLAKNKHNKSHIHPDSNPAQSLRLSHLPEHMHTYFDCFHHALLLLFCFYSLVFIVHFA